MIARLAVFVVASLALSVCANASIIPSLDSGSPVNNLDGTFTFNYTASVSADERLDPTATSGATCGVAGNQQCNPPGTFFTIYDITGFVGASTSASGWSTTVQMTGITPSSENPVDAGLPNVTFTYTGAIVDGPTDISGFQIVSNNGGMVLGQFTSQATKNVAAGTTDQVIGNVEIPASTVPEPASLALIGAGLIGLAIGRKRFAR